jgi:hypothetical protein
MRRPTRVAGSSHILRRIHDSETLSIAAASRTVTKLGAGFWTPTDIVPLADGSSLTASLSSLLFQAGGTAKEFRRCRVYRLRRLVTGRCQNSFPRRDIRVRAASDDGRCRQDITFCFLWNLVRSCVKCTSGKLRCIFETCIASGTRPSVESLLELDRPPARGGGTTLRPAA